MKRRMARMLLMVARRLDPPRIRTDFSVNMESHLEMAAILSDLGEQQRRMAAQTAIPPMR